MVSLPMPRVDLPPRIPLPDDAPKPSYCLPCPVCLALPPRRLLAQTRMTEDGVQTSQLTRMSGVRESDHVYEDEDFLLQIDSLVQSYSVGKREEERRRRESLTATQASTFAERSQPCTLPVSAPSPVARQQHTGHSAFSTQVQGTSSGRNEAPAVAVKSEGNDFVEEDEDFLLQIDSLVQNYSVGKREEEVRRRRESLTATPSTANGIHLTAGEPRREENRKASLADHPKPQNFFGGSGDVHRPRAPQTRGILQSCLSSNTLVCLPTGLGKALAAAAVMSKYREDHPDGIVVFTAPTKPLIRQQVDVCAQTTPPEKIVDLTTGRRSVDERERAWQEESAIFFALPNVVERDLARGVCPDHRVKLVIFDQCHVGFGRHPYVGVARAVGASCRLVGLSEHLSGDARQMLAKAVAANLKASSVIHLTQEEEEREIEKLMQRSARKKRKRSAMTLKLLFPENNSIIRMNQCGAVCVAPLIL